MTQSKHPGLIADMLEALRDSAEILFHLGTAGKNPSQDEAIDGVRERVLAAIAKAEEASMTERCATCSGEGRVYSCWDEKACPMAVDGGCEDCGSRCPICKGQGTLLDACLQEKNEMAAEYVKSVERLSDMMAEAEKQLLLAFWLAQNIRAENYLDQRLYLLRHIDRAYEALTGAALPNASESGRSDAREGS